MFRSSSSKRTAILVISISSSGGQSTQSSKQRSERRYIPAGEFDLIWFKRQKDSPSRRGCRTASERRLTTVSRPFTSADTAYMVVSLKWKDAKVALPSKTRIRQLLHGKLLWKTKGITRCTPWCLTVTDPSMFFQREKNFVFTSILCSGLQRGNTGMSNKKHHTRHFN